MGQPVCAWPCGVVGPGSQCPMVFGGCPRPASGHPRAVEIPGDRADFLVGGSVQHLLCQALPRFQQAQKNEYPQ